MYLLAAVSAIVALIAGIVLAARRKKEDGVVYSTLDKVGRITNILLIPVYIFFSLFITALSLFTRPGYDGFLAIIGWIVCVIIAIAPLSCGLGLGFSVALRKKGRSKLSFWVQFAGVASSALSFVLFLLFYGNLLAPLN